MSAAGRALSKALDKPEDWYMPDDFCIKHRPSGLAFWVANGGFFFDCDGMEGTPHCLGLLERHWLYFRARGIMATAKAERRAIRTAKLLARFAIEAK